MFSVYKVYTRFYIRHFYFTLSFFTHRILSKQETSFIRTTMWKLVFFLAILRMLKSTTYSYIFLDKLDFNKCLDIIMKVKTCGATRNPEFPRTGPDRTETGPGSGNIFKNIFGPGRVGEFYFGSVRVGEFYFGSVRVGVFFYRGMRHFLPGFRG